MKSVVCDVETTKFNKGAPFAQRNKLCVIGCYDGSEFHSFRIEYQSNEPYGEQLSACLLFLRQYDCVVGFNLKFDLHWLRRYGIGWSDGSIWDCQLFEFLLSNQKSAFPSLEVSCARVGLGSKLGTLSDYYDKGLDTPDIPWDELVEYNKQDCILTWQLYQKQQEEIKGKSWEKLFYNSCADLLILEECEFNGLKCNLERAIEVGDEINVRLGQIDDDLNRVFGGRVDNWASGDWLSVALYGGSITVQVQEPFIFTYKNGEQKEKLRWQDRTLQYPRLVEPLKDSELKKPGFFSTDQGTLKTLKAKGTAKEIVKLVLERARLEKRVGTYFHGIPKLYKEQDWVDSIIHGQLNQCVAVTGRLSSSKPNQQNLDPEFMKCIVSRFPKGI